MKTQEEYTQRALSIVAQNPGKYTQRDLIKELRIDYLQRGLKDPGLTVARGIIENIVENSQVDIDSVPFALTHEYRLFPKK